jgi:alkanesulfonate monooxygenase
MSIEILGVLFYKDSSEDGKKDGSAPLELDAIHKLARLFEDNDYDRVLILQNSFAADSFPIASYVAAITKRLAFMIAHRPGFVAPTMAARMFAALDHLSQGRAGIHIITGANDVELQCDGDFLDKGGRYRRSREFVDVLRRIWSATDPVTFAGEYYRFNRALSELRPYNGSIPVYWGGASPLALEYGGEAADVFAMSAVQPLADMRAFADTIRASAAKAGRSIRLQASVKMIVGDTEEAAWKRADEVLENIYATAERQRLMRESGKTAAMPGMRVDDSLRTSKGGSGSDRHAILAQGADVIDKCLWTGAMKASQSFSTTRVPPLLVGTPEQIVDSIGDYYAMGISGFLLTGFDAMEDIPVFGREVIPLIRRMAEEREQPPHEVPNPSSQHHPA